MTDVELRYFKRSSVYRTPGGTTMHLSPNLARERVAFDGELKDPLRFREAMSALHEVVVGDHRVQKKDRSAWRAWKAEQERQEQELLRTTAVREGDRKRADLARQGPPSKELKRRFKELHAEYWSARRKWASELLRSDPKLWRHLMPCDPVITVAPDVLFFEGFAKDESSYGSVYVDRDAFAGQADAELGTTNVDYSQRLYDNFQTLRTYKAARFSLDPEGFDVKVEGSADYREEKIDLPPSWLRGFGQISAATSLPARKVALPVEAVYALLTFLKGHREKQGPRSIRFELTPKLPPRLVIEPWEKVIETRGAPWYGEPATVKVWGRRRLMTLARTLPFAERVDVHLLGSGLPSIWVAHLGPMRFVLALSGWTANDFTSGAQLDLLAGHEQADAGVAMRVTAALAKGRSAPLQTLCEAASARPAPVLSALHQIARRGQMVYDFGTERYRYRQILSEELGDALLGPEPKELVEGRRLFEGEEVAIERDETLPQARRLLVGRVASHDCEAILDADGLLLRARCPCGHHRRFALRQGPCRHLLALRLTARGLSALSFGDSPLVLH